MARRCALLLVCLSFACGPDRNGGLGGRQDLAGTSDHDAGSVYGDLGGSDSGTCGPNQMAMTCDTPVTADGCGPTELCMGDGKGNGLDDDCDGEVDEACSCTPGEVQRCFLGPPAKRGVGACTDGMQTCTGGEIGYWGPCKGTLAPSAEACDGVDNDCNGCADDGLCCGGELACPTNVPEAQPYTDVKYMGASYYTGPATSWSWKVTGGPCDQLFATTTGTPPAQSFSITNGTTPDPTIHFTLSGDYTVTMSVVDGAGKTSTCTWVQHVAGPGVRVELCWDTTGFGGSDLDLHLHRSGNTADFFGDKGMASANNDCNWQNCGAGPVMGAVAVDWGYTPSPLAACAGGPAGFTWTLAGSCRNPRLDMDNILSVGVPENINIDRPAAGDKFRVLVHYFGVNGFLPTLTSHPLVNVYCGGRLKTTYGQAPDLVPGFTKAGGWAKGDMWRVADVTPTVDASGATTDCQVDALHPIGTTSGYRVGHDDKISYEGN